MKDNNAQVLAEAFFGALGAKPEDINKIMNSKSFVVPMDESTPRHNNTNTATTRVAQNAPSSYGYGSTISTQPNMNMYGSQATNIMQRGGVDSVQNLIQARNMSEMADAAMMRYRSQMNNEEQRPRQGVPAPKGNMSSADIAQAWGGKPQAQAEKIKPASAQELAELFKAEKQNNNAPAQSLPTATPKHVPTPFDGVLNSIKKMMPDSSTSNAKKQLEILTGSMPAQSQNEFMKILDKLGLKGENNTAKLAEKINEVKENKPRYTGGYDDSVPRSQGYLNEGQHGKAKNQVPVIDESNHRPQVPAPQVATPQNLQSSLEAAQATMAQKVQKGELSMSKLDAKVDKMLERDEQARVLDLEAQKKELWRFSF